MVIIVIVVVIVRTVIIAKIMVVLPRGQGKAGVGSWSVNSGSLRKPLNAWMLSGGTWWNHEPAISWQEKFQVREKVLSAKARQELEG